MYQALLAAKADAAELQPVAVDRRRAIFVPCASHLLRQIADGLPADTTILAGGLWSIKPAFVEVANLASAAKYLADPAIETVVIVWDTYTGFGGGYEWHPSGRGELSFAALAGFASVGTGRAIQSVVLDAHGDIAGLIDLAQSASVDRELSCLFDRFRDLLQFRWEGESFIQNGSRESWRRWRLRRLKLASMLLHRSAMNGELELLKRYGPIVDEAIATALSIAVPAVEPSADPTAMISMPERDRKSLAVEATIVECPRHEAMSIAAQHVTIDIGELANRNNGAIVCTPHVGPFVAGFLAVLAQLKDRPIAVMFEDPTHNPYNALWDQLFNQIEDPPKILRNDARGAVLALRHLNSGGILAVMPDLYDRRPTAVMTALAGRTWSMPRGIGWLAVKAGVPIWYAALTNAASGFFARLTPRPRFDEIMALGLESRAYLATLDLSDAVSASVIESEADWPFRSICDRLPQIPELPRELNDIERFLRGLLAGV